LDPDEGSTPDCLLFFIDFDQFLFRHLSTEEPVPKNQVVGRHRREVSLAETIKLEPTPAVLDAQLGGPPARQDDCVTTNIQNLGNSLNQPIIVGPNIAILKDTDDGGME
jgi:hypothetical protein